MRGHRLWGSLVATVEIEVVGHGIVVAEIGERLLESCERAGLPIEAACGGFACCNTCRVDVLGGAEGLSALLPEEEPFLDAPGQRLACQATVRGAARVRLAPGG